MQWNATRCAVTYCQWFRHFGYPTMARELMAFKRTRLAAPGKLHLDNSLRVAAKLPQEILLTFEHAQHLETQKRNKTPQPNWQSQTHHADTESGHNNLPQTRMENTRKTARKTSTENLHGKLTRKNGTGKCTENRHGKRHGKRTRKKGTENGHGKRHGTRSQKKTRKTVTEKDTTHGHGKGHGQPTRIPARVFSKSYFLLYG